MCVFITAVPITKLFACRGGGNNGGHVLRETTSRSLCGLVCPSRTSERGRGILCERRRGEERERERERARQHPQAKKNLYNRRDTKNTHPGPVETKFQGRLRTTVGAGPGEKPGTLTQGGALFSLVPLAWESNPKLQGGWCKTQPPAHRGI